MPSIHAKFEHDRTYEAVVAVLGGQVVEARAGGIDNAGIGPAAVGSLKVVGVAQTNATPGGGAPRGTVGGVLDQSLTPAEVKVFNREFVPVTYSTAAAYGDRLVAAADGKVAPAGATPDARTIIGWCAEKAGVPLNGVGLMKLTL